MDFLNIFEMIVLSSLIGSIIVLMILIFKGIFRNKLNFTFHYYIWLILIIKLIIPFGPQTPLNISNLYENFHVQGTTNKSTQITQSNSSKELTNATLSNPISISAMHPSNKSVISKANRIPLNHKVNIEKVFCFIWILGTSLSIAILVTGYKKLKDIVGTSIKNINSTHREILNKCKKAMNIRTEVELSYSQKINSPSLCGLIKPKILIPVSVAANIGDEEFKYIIMHELTHLKNKDIFINYAITLLSIIYWFNPLLLYAFHKMREDCEISCDGQVISYLGASENLQYGNTIIKVLELAGKSNRLIGTTSMILNSFEIKRRIIMISKYRKINFKGILLGTVVFVIIGGLGIAINTSNIISDKNIVKATTLQVKTPVITSKSTVKNTPNTASAAIIKKSTSDNTDSIVPFSADIVIYNSHADEAYPSGMKVSDVGALLSNKLVKEGFNSHFVKSDPQADYNKSYQTTRDLITKYVKHYSNTILLDIHSNVIENEKSDTRKMLFVLAKSSPHYKANKKFVDSLLGNIKNSKDVKSEINFYQFGVSYFNQDLSNNSTLVEFGNNISSDSDIETCVNALVSALKNTQKVSSN
ncbi:stage II sporulation protein P [Clostridium sp. CM028]|uniref:M56 family metallopeptidase n=1 Tax=Clostridium sp. CM028 TaxID=2851575 RepID=UPI001C6E8B8E|nr:M56 family metallopeptidase [Clostridium sp. CM028]MBW9149138.1 stage II sporulation protein P [Clostridium sp. CM028]WLC62598.1 stage II sporulation protein P [Clostridium sp. CM028]